MAADWRIEVDRSRCNGTGMCVGVAPDHFALGADHRSAPLAAVVAAAEEVRDAADCCPMVAISVTEVRSGRRVAPDE